MNEKTVTLPQLEKIAADFISTLTVGDVVYMKGDLGAGKTTFVRAALQSLLGPKEHVPSPTFTLVQTYETTQGFIWHYDLYRIDDPAEVLELGMDEAFSQGITFIEWPERMRFIYTPKHYVVQLNAADNEHERVVKIVRS